MIYSIYFEGLRGFNGPATANSYGRSHVAAYKMAGVLDAKKFLAEQIKDETKDNKFVFITVNGQSTAWHDFIKQNDLQDHVLFEMERPITNGNHGIDNRNLTLRVLSTKKKESK
jgi:hypothetical protein